jgi:hypothetical protein
MKRKKLETRGRRTDQTGVKVAKSETVEEKRPFARAESGAVGQGVRRVRIGRLRNPKDVALFMARSIKRAARGENPGIQYNLVNMASQLLKALEVSELQMRIEKLEEKAGQRKA